MATWWRNETSSVRLRWQPAEPPDDGRRARCSLAHCHRFPLESYDSEVQLHCPVVEWLVRVPAEEVGWGLTPREDGLFGLPNDEKTGLKLVRRGLINLSTMSNGCTVHFF